MLIEQVLTDPLRQNRIRDLTSRDREDPLAPAALDRHFEGIPRYQGVLRLHQGLFGGAGVAGTIERHQEIPGLESSSRRRAVGKHFENLWGPAPGIVEFDAQPALTLVVLDDVPKTGGGVPVALLLSCLNRKTTPTV